MSESGPTRSRTICSAVYRVRATSVPATRPPRIPYASQEAAQGQRTMTDSSAAQLTIRDINRRERPARAILHRPSPYCLRSHSTPHMLAFRARAHRISIFGTEPNALAPREQPRAAVHILRKALRNGRVGGEISLARRDPSSHPRCGRHRLLARSISPAHRSHSPPAGCRMKIRMLSAAPAIAPRCVDSDLVCTPSLAGEAWGVGSP
jgi:hypothetical protein